MCSYIFRWFFKLTGLIPAYLYLKPRLYYSSKMAKKSYRHIKDGTIIISNHTSISDYYLLVFTKLFRTIHTVVGEVVYKNKFMYFMNWAMGNVKVDRNVTSLSTLEKCSLLLKKKKIVAIFPEGHIEEKIGKIDNFKEGAIILALQTGKPIIPIYIKGSYGLFKRARMNVGEPIYLSNYLNNDEPSKEDIAKLSLLLKNKIKDLGKQEKIFEKYKTQNIFSFKFWFQDLTRFTAIISFPLVYPTIVYRIGDKKRITFKVKDNALLVSTHKTFVDPVDLHLKFLSRRIHVIAAEELYDKKNGPFPWILKHTGCIKYRRVSHSAVDITSFVTALDILDGGGVVGLYPEGHLYKEEGIDSFHGGAALLALLTHTKIYPYVYLNKLRLFHLAHVAIGEPIDVYDYIDPKENITIDVVNRINMIIEEKMNYLYEEGIKMIRRKKHA